MLPVAITALILLVMLTKWLVDKQEQAQRTKEMELHKTLLAEAYALEDIWQHACDADVEAAVARIQGGDLSARLSDWELVVAARCPGDDSRPAPWASTVVEVRNRRRRDIRTSALDRLEREREAFKERQRQAEWAREDARRRAEQEAAERARRRIAALRDNDPAGYFYYWLRGGHA